MRKQLSAKNIEQATYLTIISFCVGFVMWYAVEKIFLRDALGIGPSGIAAIVLVYMAVTLTLDVPAAVVADKWGRKKMLIVALVMFMASDIVLGLSQNFIHYLIGTVFWGLFTVAYYGTYEAMLYDGLKAYGQQAMFQKVDAATRMWFMIGIGISSGISGFMASVTSLRAVYLLSLIPLLIGLYCAAKLYEPSQHDDGDDEDAIEETLSHYRHFISAFRTVFSSQKLRVVALGTVFLLFSQTPLYEFVQYIYIALINDPTAVGIMGGITALGLIGGFWLTQRKQFGYSVTVTVTVAGILAIALSRSLVAIGLIVVVYAVLAVIQNALQTDLQHATRSKNRASVTSAISFMGNIAVLPIIFVFSRLAEDSIWTAYIYLTVPVFFVAVVFMLVRRRHTDSLA